MHLSSYLLFTNSCENCDFFYISLKFMVKQRNENKDFSQKHLPLKRGAVYLILTIYNIWQHPNVQGYAFFLNFKLYFFGTSAKYAQIQLN